MDNTENSTPTRLLILGNGFDLQAGLKSSFNDYYDSLKSDIIDELNSNYNELHSSTELELHEFYDKLKHCVIHERRRELLPLSRQSDWTFWDYVLFFKHLDFEHSDESINNWADVEANIQHFLEYDVNNLIKFNYMIWHSFDEASTKTILLYYIIFYIFELIPSEENRGKLNQFLIDELNRFENKFGKFLDEQIHTQDSKFNFTYEEKAAKLLKALGRNECSNILSFNYTTPVSIENNQRLQMKIRNVHGDLNSHIIIGIDQGVAKGNENNYLFTKTYRIMELANDKKESHSLNHNIKSIVFYGHSLAAADYSYFQSIFDFYSIYDSDVTLVFYYSVYDKNQKEQIIKTQFDSIRKLLMDYGDTLDNKDHGKNLLHKLLLEDRLIIKELKY